MTMMCLPQRTVRKCHLCIINDESVCWQRNVEEYSGKKLSQVEPHIFAIAEAAYQSMCSSTANQSCIISGESGAGKVTTPPRSAATTLNTGPSILSSSAPTSDLHHHHLQQDFLICCLPACVQSASFSHFSAFIVVAWWVCCLFVLVCLVLIGCWMVWWIITARCCRSNDMSPVHAALLLSVYHFFCLAHHRLSAEPFVRYDCCRIESHF